MSSESQKIKILVVFNDLQSADSNLDPDIISEIAVRDEAAAVYTALNNCGYVAEMLPLLNIDQVLIKINSFQPDVIFNLCEGWQSRTDQEMNVAGLWEMLDLPYTGNSPLTLGLAQNKVLSKNIFKAIGIPTPDFYVYESIPETCSLDFPLIAKPSREDGSIGITQDSVVNDFIELKSIVGELLAKYKQPILVEKYIAGREFNVSILGNENPQVLPPSEINFEQVSEEYFPITSYEAKWLSDHPVYQMTPPVCPAPISAELNEKLTSLSLAVYHALRGRDYGRIDIRMDAAGNLFVLEYNPNPDISPSAGFVRALNAASISYETFVDFLIKQALNRRRR